MADLLERLRAALADRYAVERELGSGGMAVVFLAHDLRHGRKVAVKVLRPELAESLATERFLREISLAARLTHPNILTLIDSGEANGLLYYIMPFVEGESLRSRLTRERQLPLEEALRLVREVADALSYAHSLGVVHRDIKPENILGAGSRPVVADFGIAQAVSDAGGTRLTQSGLAVGTPSYMSPEQATGGDQVDARSDIYSLACMLYEMLAGLPPYSGATPQAILARKVVEPVPGLRVVRDAVPPVVEAAIMKALAKVPADRFATVSGFVEALAGRGFAPPPAAATRRRRRVVLAAGGVLAVLAGAYALFARLGTGGAEPVHATFTQVTSAPGVEWFPSMSPDGRWLVYSGEGSGNRDIYLQSVGAENAINITKDSPADDDQPAFSPDGERIAFRSERDGGGIFVMGRTGDAARRVTRRGYHPTWSPDGAALAFADEKTELNPQNANVSSALWVVTLATGELRQVYAGDAVTPSWSPHGYRIAYTHRLSLGTDRGVWTVPAEGGEPVVATGDVARDWGPGWSPDGRYLYFASDRGGSMNLWRVAIDERSGRPQGAPEPVTTPATSLAHVGVAGDGRHLAYTSALITINIQRITLDVASATLVDQPAWVTTGSRRWSSPDPSPDGRWLVFYSLVQPEGNLYIARADGTELRQLTTGDSAIDRVPRWSPDGQWISFFSNRAGDLKLFRIRPDGSELQQMSDVSTSVGVWAPDGRRIAVPTVTGQGAGVYVFDPATRLRRDATPSLPQPDSVLRPFIPNSWSPDGTRLAGHIGFQDKGVVVYSFRTRSYDRLTTFGEWPVWLPDGRRVLFVSAGKTFYILDTATRRVRQLMTVGRDVIGPPRLSGDGRSVYYSRRVTEGDIWLMTLR